VRPGFSTYASGGTATPVQWTKISNVKSYSGFNGPASEIERTNFDSTVSDQLTPSYLSEPISKKLVST
jgi:hypothetical protein